MSGNTPSNFLSMSVDELLPEQLVEAPKPISSRRLLSGVSVKQTAVFVSVVPT
jgi:hypothetical protein